MCSTATLRTFKHDTVCDCAALMQTTWQHYLFVHTSTRFIVLYVNRVRVRCVCVCVHTQYALYMYVWRESNYGNECTWGVSGMSRQPASVTVCLLVTADSHSAQTWINNNREGAERGQRGVCVCVTEERKWLTCEFLPLCTHSEAYFTACEACQALLIKQKQHKTLYLW